MNNTYSFPRIACVGDESSRSSSASSLRSLKKVTYYDLNAQNETRVLDETDQLVELINELRKLEKQELYYFFG